MKTLKLAFLGIVLCSVCFAKTDPKQKPSVFVTVAPQIGIVEKIAGSHVQVYSLISNAGCPETYAPTPKQLEQLSNAKIFLNLGLPFENNWLKKIEHSELKTQTMSEGIKFRDIDQKHLHKHHKHGDKDPHIWLSIKNINIMAENTTRILSKEFPELKKEFEKNLKAFKAEIKETDEKIKDFIKKENKKHIFVMHPSYGYFADDYSLKQYSIEIDGKEPSPKQLEKTINDFKDKKASTILVQPEFKNKTANAIAEHTNAKLVPVSIYERDPLKNFEELINKWN